MKQHLARRKKDMKKLFLILALVAGSVWAEANVPGDFDEVFARLAELVDRESIGALDMARGSLDATRLIAVGAPGLSVLEPRYRGATSFGEASVAGLYMTVWGKADQLSVLQRELETNPMKRKWIYGLVGTEELFWASIAGGDAYQPLLRLLPTIGGTRAFARKCMESKDALVRRAGLFWGYWMADATYWAAVKQLVKSEQDHATLKIAQRLLLGAKG